MNAVTVTIFGRETVITAEQMQATRTTLLLLSCLDSMSERDRQTLTDAARIVARVGGAA